MTKNLYPALACILACALLLTASAWAQNAQKPETNESGEATEAPKPKPAPEEPAPTPPGMLRLHLMDGTIITGQLKTQTLKIKTEFGDLVVPITAIVRFQPGIESHPKLNQRINGLIEQLSDPQATRRDKAQEDLTNFGPALLPELQRQIAKSDQDPERKVRLANVIESLYSSEDSFEEAEEGPAVSLNRLDTIETERFTIAGRVQQQKFTIQSKFGKLDVKLADIKAAEQLSSKPVEQRKVVQVSGADMTIRAMKNTALKVKRGDKIIIFAEGKITMSPWGNNSISSPDGIAQNGMYNGKIPLGALVGRIGADGQEFLVGSKNTIVAKQSGTIYLGFAMQANWANYQFPGNYKARIRVIPAE